MTKTNDFELSLFINSHFNLIEYFTITYFFINSFSFTYWEIFNINCNIINIKFNIILNMIEFQKNILYNIVFYIFISLVFYKFYRFPGNQY